MTLKAEIIETALGVGFQRAVVASLAPMEDERRHFDEWLERDYAGGMEYLKRNPHFRTSPALLYPSSLSALIVSASYYTECPESPGANYGRVARYAVGKDYHIVLKEKLSALSSAIEKLCGRPILSKPFTDDVPLYEQAFASRHGIGFSGKNTLVIGPKLMGSYHFVAELFTDLELEPDEKYKGTCGQCFRCASACPTEAIVGPGMVDARACISYLTIENKGGIPLEHRQNLGSWVFGCDICQEVCPYNQKPPLAPWAEFQPGSGVGHYLELFGLLKICTPQEFKARFAHTPLSRPKRRGLLRNALVVIGNQLPKGGADELRNFIAYEEDPMLLEHAQWALAQY